MATANERSTEQSKPEEPKLKTPDLTANEGEGNRTADRNYRDGIKKHLATHDVEQEARDAAAALDDPEQSADLKKAEDNTRNGPARK